MQVKAAERKCKCWAVQELSQGVGLVFSFCPELMSSSWLPKDAVIKRPSCMHLTPFCGHAATTELEQEKRCQQAPASVRRAHSIKHAHGQRDTLAMSCCSAAVTSSCFFLHASHTHIVASCDGVLLMEMTGEPVTDRRWWAGNAASARGGQPASFCMPA